VEWLAKHPLTNLAWLNSTPTRHPALEAKHTHVCRCAQPTVRIVLDMDAREVTYFTEHAEKTMYLPASMGRQVGLTNDLKKRKKLLGV
jgi:hypothetical protein